MKKLLLVILIIAAGIELKSQDYSSSDFQLGIGFGVDYVDTDFVDNNIPHIQVSWDRLIAEDIGPGRITGGGFMSFSSFQQDFIDGFQEFILNYNFVAGGARGGYALYPLLDGRIEPYGGVQLIYYYLFISDENGNTLPIAFTNEGEFDFSVYAGSRFLLTDNFGAFVELDPLFVTAKFGLVFKRF